jgi:hypothetical protein
MSAIQFLRRDIARSRFITTYLSVYYPERFNAPEKNIF